MRHPGEVAVRRRTGIDKDDWGSARVGSTIPDVAARFLADQRLVVVAARSGSDLWVTLLAGAPGFVRVEDESTLTISSPIPGVDPLGAAFAERQEIGLLAIEPAARRRMRVNGHAATEGDRLRVWADQVYANCPKYIQARTVTGEAAAAPGAPLVSDTLTGSQRSWIADANTFFVGTGARGHGLDVSHRGGNPGFVEVIDGRRIAWPDYVGNSMYMTLGNLELDPRAALLFVDWERGHTLQVRGRARVDWDVERTARHPGAQRMVDLEVDEVVQIDQRIGLSWRLEDYSRFNPPLTGTSRVPEAETPGRVPENAPGRVLRHTTPTWRRSGAHDPAPGR